MLANINTQTHTHKCKCVAVSARSRVIVAFIASQCGLWHLRGISNSQHWLPASVHSGQPKPQHQIKQQQYLATTTTTATTSVHLQQKSCESASAEIVIAQPYQKDSKYFVFFLLYFLAFTQIPAELDIWGIYLPNVYSCVSEMSRYCVFRPVCSLCVECSQRDVLLWDPLGGTCLAIRKYWSW